MNAYYMLVDLRDNVGEASAKHWGDNDLLRKLNFAHRARANELMSVPGDWLMTSDDLTPVASVITLPSDCVKPSYMEITASEEPISLDVSIRERRLTRLSAGAGGLEAYPVGNTLEVNTEGFTDEVTLWYLKRIRDLHAGTADAGAATEIALDTDNEHSVTDDYYNGVTIDIVSGTGAGSDTITDYTGSTGACVVTGTYSSSSIYGTVSELPEEADRLVVLDATLLALAKPSASMDPKYFEYFYSIWKDAKKDWNNFISTRISGSNRTRITETD